MAHKHHTSILYWHVCCSFNPVYYYRGCAMMSHSMNSFSYCCQGTILSCKRMDTMLFVPTWCVSWRGKYKSRIIMQWYCESIFTTVMNCKMQKSAIIVKSLTNIVELTIPTFKNWTLLVKIGKVAERRVSRYL